MEDKRLILISDESENFDATLNKIEEFIKLGSDIKVLSLTILTSVELRKRNIPYVTPNFYFDFHENEDIDITALKYAKNWYKSFEKKITYKDISLGEMYIYDFYFLFIDALRSIRIAEKIIEIEKPFQIYVPTNQKIHEPNFICYETLTNAFNLVGENNKIKIKKFESPNYKNKSDIEVNDIINKFRMIISNIVFGLINFYQMNILSCFINRKNVIFSLESYSYEIIKNNLKIFGFKFLRIYPIPLKNKNTKEAKKNIILFHNQLKNKNFDLKLSYVHYDLFKLLERQFEEIFVVKFNNLIEYIEWTDKLIEKFPANFLVTMEDVTPKKRMIVKKFKQKKIQSLIIQHGMVSKDMAGFGVMPIEADVQAVWGNYSYQWHLKRGNSAQVITGNPSFDKLLDYKVNKNEMCKKFGLDIQKKIILITTSRFAGISAKYTFEWEEKLISDTFKCLKKYENFQVVVKLHPAYQEKYEKIILELANEINIKIIIIRDNFWEILSCCDLMITFASSTGLDALIFNKLLVTVDTVFQEDIIGYGMNGVAFNMNSSKQFDSFLKKFAINSNIFKNQYNLNNGYVLDNTYLLDGKSSERVAELINKIINDC